MNTFADFIKEMEKKAEKEGIEAKNELEKFKAYFVKIREKLIKKLERKK